MNETFWKRTERNLGRFCVRNLGKKDTSQRQAITVNRN